MVDVRLILDMKEGPALCCDLKWPFAPRIGDHIKIPTHAENTFQVKSVEWLLDGSARITLTPKVHEKFREDLMSGHDPWQHPMEVSNCPKWKEYFSEKGSSLPYRK